MAWTHCVYCGVHLVSGRRSGSAHNQRTKDHIYPRSKGGWWVVACCSWCNSRKGDLPLYKWIRDERLRDRKITVWRDHEYIAPLSNRVLIRLYRRGRPKR